MGKYLICVTGASGAIYGIRTMRALVETGHEVHSVVSPWGEKVIEHETGKTFSAWADEIGIPRERIYPPGDMGALAASGSFKLDGTVVAPCSMSSAGAIASGFSHNLIHRSAQVSLKEGRPLVLVPRETPLSLTGLRSLAALAEAGAIILPASPAFYHLPASMDDLVDFVAGKILDRLSVNHHLNISWRGMK